MGPIVRLVSLILILGTWYALSGRPVSHADLHRDLLKTPPAIAAASTPAAPEANLDAPYLAEGAPVQAIGTPVRVPKENIRDRLGLPRTAYASAQDTADIY
jgi:hypothetical protein